MTRDDGVAISLLKRLNQEVWGKCCMNGSKSLGKISALHNSHQELKKRHPRKRGVWVPFKHSLAIYSDPVPGSNKKGRRNAGRTERRDGSRKEDWKECRKERRSGGARKGGDRC